MPVHIFCEGVSLPEGFEETSVANWLMQTAATEKSSIEDLNVIFCTDAFLHDLNVGYLSHDTYTDIITFDYTKASGVNGELYISLDRVKENATQLDIILIDELLRVIVHGLLHLLGYGDNTSDQKKAMTLKEDYYLSLRSF
jgi:rRNA maturation RNase YbeY